MLPVELWCKVIRSATLIPGSFDTSFILPLDAWGGDTVIGELYTESMQTKLNIATVCKAWYQIALPLIYEFILIHSSNHYQLLDALTSTLGDSNRGRFVRRLIIFHGDISSVAEFHVCINRILQKCINIEIYTHSVAGFYNADTLFDTLFTHCGHSLRRLKLTGFVLPPDIRDVLSQKASQLRIMSILGNIRSLNEINAPLILPHLHTLALSYSYNSLFLTSAQGKFRHLRSLSLEGHSNHPGSDQINEPPLPDCPALQVIDASGWSLPIERPG